MFFRRAKLVEQPKPVERFMHKQDRNRKRVRIVRLIGLIVLFILICTGITAGWNALRVHTVVCTTQPACTAEQRDLLTVFEGRSLLLPLPTLSPEVEGNIIRRWPHTLEVVIREPSMLVTFTASDSAAVSLTEKGIVVRTRTVSEPQVLISDTSIMSLSDGSSVSSAKLEFYKNLINTLRDPAYSFIQSVDVVDEATVVLTLDQRSTAIMSQSDSQAQLRSLQAISRSSTIERQGRTIDLRFGNPVVK